MLKWHLKAKSTILEKCFHPKWKFCFVTVEAKAFAMQIISSACSDNNSSIHNELTMDSIKCRSCHRRHHSKNCPSAQNIFSQFAYGYSCPLCSSKELQEKTMNRKKNIIIWNIKSTNFILLLLWIHSISIQMCAYCKLWMSGLRRGHLINQHKPTRPPPPLLSQSSLKAHAAESY